MQNCFVAAVPKRAEAHRELRLLLGKMKRTLRERDVEARWSHPDLWHVTVQFLGPLDESGRGRLLERMRAWRPHVGDLRLRLRGLGGFPSAEHARVLWVGVGENQEFLRLQAELADFLRAGGFALKEEAFTPHMTLARLRNAQGLSDLIQLGARKHFGDYEVREFIVFQSVLQGQMTKYVPLLRVPLSENDSARPG